MSATAPRWYGLDLIRLICYFCIVEFHFGLFYFGAPATKYTDVSWILWAVDRLGHLLMLSGFVIAFLSSFLLAMRSPQAGGKARLFGVFAIGCVYLSIGSSSPVGITWDVFSLFFTAMLVIVAAEKRIKYGVPVLGVLGYAMLWIPFWQFASDLPWGHQSLKNILGLAACSREEVAEWPLLPWAGLIWFGYAIGAQMRPIQASGDLSKMRLGVKEGVLWTVLLAASVPQLGAYYSIRMGRYFSCEAYRQEPVVFWSHFVWALLLIRLAFDPRVQDLLGRRVWMRQISGLALSRKFWLAYALQYVAGMSLALVINRWEQTADPDIFAKWELPLLELVAVVLLPLNEFLTGHVWRLLTKIQQLAAKARTRHTLPQEVAK